jgi:hypothetical protein
MEPTAASSIWLRKDRPWVYDVVRVLAPRPAGLTLQQLYREVRTLRGPTNLPKPIEFEATVRRTIYDFSSDAKGWNGAEENDLFKSPRRGMWMVNRDRAIDWIVRHENRVHHRTLTPKDFGF